MNKNNTKFTKLIGLVEGLKGLAAILAAFGFLSLLHHDLHRLALELIGHFDLDPTTHYPELLLDFVDKLIQTRVSSVILLAIAYAAIRITEGVGLWFGFTWGDWLAAVSGGIYLPFELRHLIHSPHWVVVIVFLVNLVIVIYLVNRLINRLAKVKQTI